jgi:hypothetical protein
MALQLPVDGPADLPVQCSCFSVGSLHILGRRLLLPQLPFIQLLALLVVRQRVLLYDAINFQLSTLYSKVE